MSIKKKELRRDSRSMPEARANDGNSISASLSLLPSPKAPGASSTCIPHTCRMTLYILSRLGLRLHAGSKDMTERSLTERSLSRVQEWIVITSHLLPLPWPLEIPRSREDPTPVCAPYAVHFL